MMKKSLVALAVLAASTGAMAQSSVTLFGVADLGVAYVNGSGAGHRTGISSGSNAASRLGFRGTEDLGGGLSASFWLESGLSLDAGTGAATGGGMSFNRRSTVSLSNQYGELRLGRDFVPTWWNVALLDPFGARGVGTSQAANNLGYNAVWNNNSIGYVLPTNLGGIYGQFQYAFGEKASTTANDKQGNSISGRLGYQKGALNVAAAYTEIKQIIGASDTVPVVIGRDLKIGNIAATWTSAWSSRSSSMDRKRSPAAPSAPAASTPTWWAPPRRSAWANCVPPWPATTSRTAPTTSTSSPSATATCCPSAPSCMSRLRA